MEIESNTAGLWKAMLETQKEVEHAVKDAKNPHLKNRYASLCSVLDAIKPIANKNGLVITQHVMAVPQDRFPDMTAVVTRITHAATGASIEDNQTIPLPKKDPQGLGSAITYARRYGLQAMFGISSEDDDGNTASNITPKAESKPEPKPEDKTADHEKIAEVQQRLSRSIGFAK